MPQNHAVPPDPWIPSERFLFQLDWLALFGNSNPVEIELGAGDGGFILAWAARFPDMNFLAVERLLGRVRKIVKRTRALGLTNLRVLRLESSYVISRMCPPGSVARIHIMFPDPWPKRKHHKHRLIQIPFLEACHRALVPGGTVRFTTDHAEYFDTARKQWATAPGWIEEGPWDASGDPPTDFQKMWEAQGRTTYRTAWRTVPLPDQSWPDSLHFDPGTARELPDNGPPRLPSH